MNNPIGKLFVLLLAATAIANASDITFSVDFTGIGGGSVTGTITTDGKTSAALATNDIVSWNLLLNDGTTTFDLNNGDSTETINGTDLTETATQLLYNFAGDGYWLFYDSSGGEYFCVETTTGGCNVADAEVLFINSTDGVQEKTGLSGDQAIGTATPEPGTLALLGLGAGIFLVRRRKSTNF